MQAIILAAGYGSRLGDFTTTLPKPMVPISSGHTMLSLVLDNLETIEISRAVIMVGHASETIDRWVAEDQARYTFDVITEPVTDITGSNASTLLDGLVAYGSEEIIVHNGDTLTSPEVLQKIRRRVGQIVLAIDAETPLTEEAMKTTIDRGNIRRVSKGLDVADAHGEYIGISLIPRELVEHVADTLRDLVAEGADEYYEDAFDAIAQTSDLVVPAPIPPIPWIEVDTPQDLEAARRMFAL